MTLVGYGQTGTYNQDAGIKRKATSYIWGSTPAYYDIEGFTSLGDLCFGDSGGPVFHTTGGVERVTSVASGSDTGQCGQGSYASRTSGAFGLRVHAAAGRDVHMTTWRNPSLYVDVNNDGYVSSLDALLVINRLNAFGAGVLPTVNTTGFFIDVNGDGYCSAIDALQVINYLNAN